MYRQKHPRSMRSGGVGGLRSFVFPARGDAAPDVAFGLIFVQNLLDLEVEGAVKDGQTLPDVLVYGGFADTEFPGCTPDCCLILYDVQSQLAGSLLNISFQKTTRSNLRY